MNIKTIFNLTLVIVIIGIGIYWFITRPTPQELVVRDFFNEVRRGNVDNADKYLVDSSYGQCILGSVIIDSGKNGKKDLKEIWGNEVGNIENMARGYIPAAKGHVTKFEVASLDTQKSKSEPDRVFVLFEFNMSVREAFDSPSFPCDISGTSEVHKVNGEWLIKRFDIEIRLQDHSIEEYIEYYNM